MSAEALAADAAVSSSRAGARFHPLRVAGVEALTEDAVAITFEVPPELRETYRFTQGQHVAIRCRLAGDDVRRNYSLCCSAGSQKLRVAVKRLDGGAFSTYAHNRLAPGDVLEVLPPHGRFFTQLDPTHRKRYVAVAAGSGIAPVLSLLATTLEVEPHSTFTLFYGNRTTNSIMFLEELEDHKNRHPARLAIHHVLSRETRGMHLLDGRIDGARLRRFCAALVQAAAVDEWFLCGPMPMVEDLLSTLGDLGVDARRVHRELFYVGATAGRAPSRPAAPRPESTCRVTIRLDDRQSTFGLEASRETILDAVLRERGDAPYACRAGVCATCRARLIEGEVRMDNEYALEDDEKEAGYVLTCQARPTTSHVHVDYDA